MYLVLFGLFWVIVEIFDKCPRLSMNFLMVKTVFRACLLEDLFVPHLKFGEWITIYFGIENC